MHDQTIKTLSQFLRAGHISSYELTEHFLNRIEAASALNAFISIDKEQSLKQARHADEMLRKGVAHPLTGIPIAHKDIFCTKHWPATCASKMLENYTSPFDATIVERFTQQGCVTVGKTNMDEFGMGSSSENSYFGAVKNPWNHQRSSGGSSGGSAAAVAAGLTPLATASDTGGSIRQPAAFCGVTGIKPSYGLVSRFGLIAFASSLDQAGPMAKSAEDLAFALPVMTGHDPKDSTSLAYHVPDYINALSQPIKPLRIGIPKSFLEASTDPAIQTAFMSVATYFEAQGAELVELDFKLLPYWVPCYYVIVCAEASSNLARYDGVRFGYRTDKADNIKDLIRKSRTEAFGDEVKRRILTGTHVLSAGYFDAYYIQALKIRRLIQNEFIEAFKQVDVIIGPTSPSVSFPLGEQKDPVQNYLQDKFTVAANLAGLPAMSFPAGMKNNLPIGVQWMGPRFSEARLLNLTHHFQQQSDWHQKLPLDKG